MSYLEVDPALLASTGARLRDAVAVAEEVAARKGELAALADDAGDDRLTATVHDFLGTWAHGLGCLVEDAGTLAGMLADSGRVYLQVETGIAAAATPGERAVTAGGGPQRDLAPVLARWAAGDVSPEAFQSAFETATLWVRRVGGAQGGPAVAAVGEPGAGYLALYTSPESLAGHVGECDWACGSGRDLLALVPAGYGLVVDPAGAHPAVLPAGALRRGVVVTREQR